MIEALALQTLRKSSIPAKKTVVLVRWPVVLVSSYLLVYSNLGILFPVAVLLLPFFYVASNIVLYYLKEEYLSQSRVLSALVVFDTLVLTLCLVANGKVDSDLYLSYFLIIIISCLLQDLRSLAIVTVLAPVIYGSILFRFSDTASAALYLRLPFLFITSLFFGYFAYLIRTERALRELSEKENRAKMEIYNVVSHEFRTPLSVAMGFIQLIKDKILGDINEAQEKSLDSALKQCNELVFTIDNVLEAGRLTAAASRVEKNELNLAAFAAELKAGYDSSSALRTVALQWDYPPQLPVVIADRAKFKIILQNLINNAIRFTKQGEIKISIRCDTAAERVEFQVVDTGIGITEDARSLIFEQFRQLDSSDTRAYGGVGLGLYIVREFTKILGGAVEVESELGKGSAFKVSIPVGSHAQGAQREKELTAAPLQDCGY